MRNNDMTTKEERLANYPNIESKEYPWLIGCVSEVKIEDAKNFFLRTCYKDVIIHKIVPWKRNVHPSCAWRVIYKLKDKTPNLVEAGETVEDFIIPLPEDDQELKKLFHNITTMVFGMYAAQKGYSADKVYAMVDFVPYCCVCPVKDFNKTAKLIPRMQSSVTEVSLTFCNMELC